MNISTLILIITIIVTGFTAFIAYIGKKEIVIKENELLTDKANFYLDLLLVTVDEIVKATNQSVVDKLKADGDGKLTKEEADDIFNEVKGEVLHQITNEGMAILNEVIRDVPKLIEFLIESAVRKNK